MRVKKPAHTFLPVLPLPVLCFCLLFATRLLLTCGGLAVLGFAGFFIYKLCKKERGGEEDVDMDYSVAVTNSMFREERSGTSFISTYTFHFLPLFLIPTLCKPHKGQVSLSK